MDEKEKIVQLLEQLNYKADKLIQIFEKQSHSVNIDTKYAENFLTT